MSIEISELNLPVQKGIDLGIIDNWFRGIAFIVPQAATSRDIRQEFDVRADAMALFNVHTLTYQSRISTREIEGLSGFRQLLLACSKNDVRVDITDCGRGRLRVVFNPEEAFLRSQVFGQHYTDALPIFLTPKGK